MLLLCAVALMLFAAQGCSSSGKSGKETEERKTESAKEAEYKEAIFIAALQEQSNPMYRKEADTTLLYWLGNYEAQLSGYTKCNVFALNVLEKAGYLTPDENCTTRELFDTTQYTDILPVIAIDQHDAALPGDLIVWNGHVIIFEKTVVAGGELYAQGWWAGTRQNDNGENIKNNVCYGKYRLNGNYLVRRPQKKL